MTNKEEKPAAGELVGEVCEPLRVEPQNGKDIQKGDGWFLYFCALSVGLSYLSIGCASVWTSPVMKHLKSSDPLRNPLTNPVTTYQVSILTGMMSVGCLAGPVILGQILDRYGRKNTLIFFSFCNAVSFITIALARTVYLYYLARFLVGVSISLIGAIPIFITEVTENHNRGKFGILLSIFVPIGNLYGSSIGPFLSVRMFSLMCALPSAISLCMVLLFIPETPIHLATIGRKQKALKALSKFRGRSKTLVEDDYSQIKKTLTISHREDVSIFELLKERCFRKCFFISVWVNVFQLASGIVLIMGFMGPIFDDAKISLSGDMVAVLVISVKILFFVVVTTIIERVGRRPLLLISALGTMISLFNVGLYFHLKSIQYSNLESISLLPVVSIVLFFVSYGLGLGPIPQMLMSELFPSDIIGTAISVVLTSASVFFTIQSFGFPIVMDFLGTATCFWIFSAFCFLGFVYMYFAVPETKGKDIMEIQNMLS